jgi:hypothetical protein
VGTIGGAIIGSSAQKKASSQANDTQQAATQAQLQLGRDSLAVQQQLAQQSLALQDKLAGQGLAANLGIYNSNYGMLSPFVSRGNVAGDAINALLGLPTAPTMTSPMANGIPSFPGLNAPAAGAPASPAAPAAPAAPAQQQSLDQWATGALNALLPNITQPDNIAAINAAATPMDKLNAALAISPPTSNQYPAYAAYIAQNPKPAAPAAPAAAPAAPAAPAAAPAAAATASAPRLGSFVVNGNFDMDAYRASRGQTPAAPQAAPAPVPQAPAPQGTAPVATSARPNFVDYRGDARGYLDALRAWRTGGGAPGAAPAGGAAPAAPAATPQSSALNNFANSAGMQFQLEQGTNAIENSAAGRGALQ